MLYHDPVRPTQRRKRTRKRGGERKRLEDGERAIQDGGSHDDLSALDEALTEFESRWPEKGKIVKLRYFAGLTIPYAAKLIGVSRATADRHSTIARAWLQARLRGDS